MSVEATPPPPPQLSPDGKYVWDGSQWRPIAGVAEPSHAAIFAAWNSLKVDPADPVAEAPEAAAVPVFTPVQVQEPAPEIDYSYTVNDPTITPLWRQNKGSGLTKYLYVGAGLVVFVIAVMLLNSLNLQLPWTGVASSSSPSASAQPSPTPDTSGTDYVRADRFLVSTLTPPLSALEKTVQTLDQHCDGTMSNSCFNALNASEDQLKKVLAAVNLGDIPKCIAGQMSKVLIDMQAVDKQLQLALTGYQDSSADELATGVYRFKVFHRLMLSDLAAVRQVQEGCHKVILPSWVP